MSQQVARSAGVDMPSAIARKRAAIFVSARPCLTQSYLSFTVNTSNGGWRFASGKCCRQAVWLGCDLADSLRSGVGRYGESLPLLLAMAFVGLQCSPAVHETAATSDFETVDGLHACVHLVQDPRLGDHVVVGAGFQQLDSVYL